MALRIVRSGLLGIAFLTAAGASQAELGDGCGAHWDPEEILRRINEIRAAGKACRASASPRIAGPLLWSESLATAALTQAREMVHLRRMSHRDRNDHSLAVRLSEQGYPYVAAAENLAVGYPSFDDVVEAWLESEGHCENLMNGAVLESGLACVDGSDVGTRDERRYWTLVLGARAAR